MPRFHFNIYDGVTDIDHTGVELADWQEAPLVAIQHAGTIFKDDPKRLALGEDWRMEVTDDTGLILFRLDFSVMEAPALLTAGPDAEVAPRLVGDPRDTPVASACDGPGYGLRQLKPTRMVAAHGHEPGDCPRAPDRLRVPIVDDNVFYAEALRRLLERERHTVVGVTDHAAASFDLARSERPHLALVDLHLCDGCSGPELGRPLAREGVCVLFLTAAPALAPTDERGLLGVLSKPAGDARLLRAVADARERIGSGHI